MGVLRVVAICALGWIFAIAVSCQRASAQETEALREPGELRLRLGDFRGVRRGQVAPDDGILMAPETILQIQIDYDALALRLTRERERAEDRCQLQLDMQRARTRAESERVTLRDGLWAARERELVEAVRRAREEAVRQWHENPGFWAGVGALVASLVAILVSQI